MLFSSPSRTVREKPLVKNMGLKKDMATSLTGLSWKGLSGASFSWSLDRHQGNEDVAVTLSSHTLCQRKDVHIIFVTPHKASKCWIPNHPQAGETQALTIITRQSQSCTALRLIPSCHLASLLPHIQTDQGVQGSGPSELVALLWRFPF